jgi:hypothetical protein
MDEVLKEALILQEGEELFAPADECKPFILELETETKSSETEVTAH